jgi:uncharacterized protein (TIGR02246 family)
MRSIRSSNRGSPAIPSRITRANHIAKPLPRNDRAHLFEKLRTLCSPRVAVEAVLGKGKLFIALHGTILPKNALFVGVSLEVFVDASSTKESIQPTIDALNAAWNRGDGKAFAAQCTEDVDFINLLGMHVKGRAAVIGMHETIFKGPFAGSTLEFSIECVRAVANDAIVAVVPGELEIPSGPVKGHVRTVATVLFVREESEWHVASFQNTKREATEPNYTRVMLETFSEKSKVK